VCAGVYQAQRQDASATCVLQVGAQALCGRRGVRPAPRQQPKHHVPPRGFSSIVITIFSNLLMIIIIIIIFRFTFQIKSMGVFQY